MPRDAYYISEDRHVRAVVAALDKRTLRGTASTGPAIPLANENGILERAGVRHVVFRAETVQLLLSVACSEDEGLGTRKAKYHETCIQIGRTAAKDLWNCLASLDPRRVVLPKTLDRFLQVWSGWDRSGGWGRCTFAPLADAKPMDDTVQYRARVEKNFLRPEPSSTAEYPPQAIHDFWRGYIHGFLSDAIVHAYQPIYEVSAPELAIQEASQYRKVVDVRMDESNDQDLTTEQFIVRLSPNPLLPLWDHLGNAYRAKLMGDYSKCIYRCDQAVAWVKRDHRTRDHVEELLEDGERVEIFTDDQFECMQRMHSGEGKDDRQFVQLAYESLRVFAEVLHDRIRKKVV